MPDGKRFVLIKPGDVLVFGQVGQIDTEAAVEAVDFLRTQLGVEHVMFFSGDIEMDSIKASAVDRGRNA